MNFLQLSLFLITVSGLFIYFGVNPITILDEIIDFMTHRKMTLKDRVMLSNRLKKRNSMLDVISSAQKTLTINNKGNQFLMYCVASVICFGAGIMIGTLLDNPFGSVVLSVGFAYMPFLLVRFLSYSYQRSLNGELETALSVITTAYQHNEDLFGVIKDNIVHVKEPLSTVFEDFVFEIEYINPSLKNAIQVMRRKIDNKTWQQWCDALLLCQENKTMRSALNPIVHKFSDIRIVSEDLSYALYDPLKELVIMGSFLLGTPFFIYFASQDWYELLMTTKVGQVTQALNWLLLFVSLHAGVMHSKPVSY